MLKILTSTYKNNIPGASTTTRQRKGSRGENYTKFRHLFQSKISETLKPTPPNLEANLRQPTPTRK